MTKDDAFARLAKSKFRSRFKLTAKDREYIVEKGMATMRSLMRSRRRPSIFL